MAELPWDEAYTAACREVGLTGTEVAAQRYRRAVDAALAVLRPHIKAEALREAAEEARFITMVYDQVSDDEWRRWMRERADESVKPAKTDGCTFYPDGMHQNTESMIPASYSACKCGWQSVFNPDRHA